VYGALGFDFIKVCIVLWVDDENKFIPAVTFFLEVQKEMKFKILMQGMESFFSQDANFFKDF
jgi:hypothetical protein